MEKTIINLEIDTEKFHALEFSLKKESSTVQKRMEQALKELYEQTVPESVREYIESKTAPPTKPKRASKPPKTERTPTPLLKRDSAKTGGSV